MFKFYWLYSLLFFFKFARFDRDPFWPEPVLTIPVVTRIHYDPVAQTEPPARFTKNKTFFCLMSSKKMNHLTFPQTEHLWRSAEGKTNITLINVKHNIHVFKICIFYCYVILDVGFHSFLLFDLNLYKLLISLGFKRSDIFYFGCVLRKLARSTTDALDTGGLPKDIVCKL